MMEGFFRMGQDDQVLLCASTEPVNVFVGDKTGNM